MKFYLVSFFLVNILTAYNLNAGILTLAEAEHKAVTIGFVMREQYFEEQAKEWEKRNIISRYFPTLDYNLNYLRMDDETVKNANFGIEMIEEQIEKMTGIDVDFSKNMFYQNTISHEFSVNQPISNGGVEIVAIRIAKHTKKAIDFQREVYRQESIYNTRKAYFDAISASEITKFSRHTLSWARNNLQKTEIKYEIGSVPVTDVLQWKTEILKKESELLLAEATENLTILSLFQTMGISIDSAHIDNFSLQPFESFEKLYKRGLLSTEEGIENNPQLNVVKEYTEVSKENKKIPVTYMLPKLNTFAKYSRDQGWNEDSDIVNKPKSWTIGASLNVPLFSGFRNSTSYKKSKYQYMKAIIEEKKIESQMKINLERIKLFYKASYKSVKAAQKQRELMEKQVDILQSRYGGGQVNQTDLIEAFLGLNQVKNGYIMKIFEFLLYEAEYLKTIGKLEVAK